MSASRQFMPGKSKSLISLIVLAILAPSCGGGSDGAPPKPPIVVKWQTQQRSPTSSDLRACMFANANQGIIGGKDGTIFRTDDGGLTWTQQEFLPSNRGGDILAMGAFGTTLAAAGRDAVSPTLGRIWDGRNSTSWVTADGPGVAPMAPATTSWYSDINVSDPGLGNVPGTYWAVRQEDGRIDYSFNGSGGTQITERGSPAPPLHVPPEPPIDWKEANGILFVGVTGFGFICGQEEDWLYPDDPVAPAAYTGQSFPEQGMIIRTSDFGFNWIRQVISPDPTKVKTFRRFSLTRATTGVTRAYVVGDSDTNSGVLYVTSYGVADQWEKVNGTNVPAAAPRFRAVSFPVNDLAGWVVGDGGTIYKVTATATAVAPITYTYTWNSQTPGAGVTTADLYAVSFVDNNTGYAVGDGGVVIKTTNGGTNWTKISKGAAVNFNAAAFTDDGVKGIAVGDAGAVYRTLDGGLNWTSMGSPAGVNNLRGASVPRGAPTTAFLCGAGGTLLRNTDVWGVGTWSPAATGTNAADTYEAILFPQGADKGVCVGSTVSGRKLLRTTDGNNWADAATLPLNIASNSYLALSSNPAGTEVYASGGTNGKVSLSQDLANGWDSWVDSPLPPGGSLTLPSVAAPLGSSFTAFAGANNGEVFRLATGSGVWTSAGTPFGGANASRLAYQSDQTLICVTSDGRIFTTSNGGGSWQQSYAHTKDLARNVWMSPTQGGLGYVVCGNGTILKTVTGGQ
jgi:photosystem II stability/assembly factor-like uncharacterized protein